MKILIVEPGKTPQRADIPHTLKDMQRTVGGSIQAVYPWDDPVALVCDSVYFLSSSFRRRCGWRSIVRQVSILPSFSEIEDTLHSI